MLKPWFDLEPDAELPGYGPIADLLGAPRARRASTLRDDLTLDVN